MLWLKNITYLLKQSIAAVLVMLCLYLENQRQNKNKINILTLRQRNLNETIMHLIKYHCRISALA